MLKTGGFWDWVWVNQSKGPNSSELTNQRAWSPVLLPMCPPISVSCGCISEKGLNLPGSFWTSYFMSIPPMESVLWAGNVLFCCILMADALFCNYWTVLIIKIKCIQTKMHCDGAMGWLFLSAESDTHKGESWCNILLAKIHWDETSSFTSLV